jgi:predicted site-specific integrase-resolvase
MTYVDFNIDSSKLPPKANLTQWGKHLKVSYQTLLKYRKEGKLPGIKTPSRDVLISKETVMKCFGITKE